MPSGPRSVKSPRNQSRAVPAHQLAGRVDQALLPQRGHQFVQVAVHISYDEQRTGALRRLRSRHRRRVHRDLNRVTPTDDGQVALRGCVALRIDLFEGLLKGLLIRSYGLAGLRAVGVRTGLVDVRGYPEVAQRRRPLHLGSLTGPLSHRPLHHRAAAAPRRTAWSQRPAVSWAHHRNADRAM